jgi:DNA polymerase IIIc chi subunit
MVLNKPNSLTVHGINSRAVFFQGRQQNEKLLRLTATCVDHFNKKEPITIFVEDEKGALFVDELLWKFPSTSFLPHTLEGEDFISITSVKKKFGDPKIAFNLCSTPLLLEGFKIIYDFEDLTSPSKKNFSSLRFDAYKQAGYLIEARN